MNRSEKLHALHHQGVKSFIPTGIPSLSGGPSPSGLAPPSATNVGTGGGGGGGGSSSSSNAATVASLSNGLQQPQAPTTSSSQQTTALPQPRQRISDDEFLRLGPVDMLKFVRKTETDIARLAAEQHRQIQTLVHIPTFILSFHYSLDS